MKSSEYWKKRGEQLAAREFGKADQYENDLKREYYRASSEIRRSIEVFYHRYAVNDGVDMAEARRQLSGRELKEFKMTLEEFTALANDNADGRWTQLLNNVYYRTRVSRFEALQIQIQHQAEMLAGSQQKGARALLGDVYEDTYYRTLFDLQKGTGVGTSFARINTDGLQKILGTEFAGSNWSKRIWGDRDKLVSEIRTKLAQSFIRGDSAERMIKDVTDRFDVSRSNAERLVQTETAFFAGQATMDGYKASGVVDRYELLATLDSRTTTICRALDGKIFPLSEMDVSVNYPPLHARCRTTTVPYFDDEIDPGERIAKGDDGKSYYVPGNMTYQQWHNKYVNNRSENGDKSTGSHESFEAAKDVKEAEDYAIHELGFASASYKGLDIDGANTLNRAMKKVFERYPEIQGFAGRIQAKDTDKFVAQAVLEYTDGKIQSSLNISTKYYQSDQLSDIIKASVDAKHWPPGTNAESIFVHEFGHLLEYAYALKKRGAWVGELTPPDEVQLIWASIQNGTLSKEIRTNALKNLQIAETTENIKNELSGYANKNSKEFLAESFAEAEGTPKPRRLAVEAIRLLREKLKEVGLL